MIARGDEVQSLAFSSLQRHAVPDAGTSSPRLVGYPEGLRTTAEPKPTGTSSIVISVTERRMVAESNPDEDDERLELPRVSTGSKGLDDILGGGLDANRLYLYEGRPGTGKTTIALQFLLAGARNGERVLYITLSETESELKLVAKRHNWSLAGIDIFELVPPETTLDPEREVTVFHPADMELSETTRLVFAAVERINPTRVVLDSLSELRLLAQIPLRYRRQVLALKHFFTRRNCTIVLLDDLSASQDDLQLHSIANGVVLLEQRAIEYGAERRRVFRGLGDRFANVGQGSEMHAGVDAMLAADPIDQGAVANAAFIKRHVSIDGRSMSAKEIVKYDDAFAMPPKLLYGDAADIPSPARHQHCH